MTIYDLKPAFQNLLRPICSRLANAGATANQVTVAALLLSLACGAALASFPSARWAALLVPAWLFVRMALNAIDGMLAREHNMKSALGGLLNEIGDVISDTAIYIAFAFVPGINPQLVILVVLLAIFTEMAGVVAVQIGASRRYDGPMGKSDRAFAFGLLGLLLGLGIEPAMWMNYGLIAIAILTGWTIINRSMKALAEIQQSGSTSE